MPDEPTTHDRIYLHADDGEVMWCEDRIDVGDVEYVRADALAQAERRGAEKARIELDRRVRRLYVHDQHYLADDVHRVLGHVDIPLPGDCDICKEPGLIYEKCPTGPRCVEHVPDCIDISRIDQYAVTVVGDWARRGDPVQ